MEDKSKLDLIINEISLLKKDNESLHKEMSDLKQFISAKFDELFKILKEKDEKNKILEEKKKDIYGKTSLVTKKEEISLLSSALSNTEVFNKTKIKDLKFELIYSTTRDAWNNAGFHSKCNNINNTLIIIKTTEDKIFGGFTTKNWNSQQGVLKDDKNAFVFSFVTNKFYPVIDGQKAIFTSSNGPCFYSYANNMIQFSKSDLRSGNTEIAQNSFYSGITKDYEINGGNYSFEAAQIDVLKVWK